MPHFIKVNFTLILIVFASSELLPRDVIPKEYTLQILTILDEAKDDSFSFKGSVLIHIKCVSPTDRITLHSKDLKIDEGKTTLTSLNQTNVSLSILETSQGAVDDFLTLKLVQTLQADRHYELELHFEGVLNETKLGYFRSSYLNEDDERIWLAVTYFKPNHARRAFPCFDEFTFKAKFTISLGRSIRHKSLSNMPLVKTEKMKNKDDWVWDHFQTTPPMFIYLVGFIVTDFQNQTIEDHRDLININLGLWGREKVVNSRFGQGSVEITAGFLHTLKANLNMKYLLPKLDVVAIPNYPVPAMEDWGLLIWQEQHWKQITRPSIGSDILGIMADQTVNQVFGNVVTIKSWSDMWLIQGFSAYLSATVVDSTMEGYEWLFSEITDNIVHVINFDSMQNVKAISILSNRSASLDEVMVDNVRTKNFILIRMLSYFVGSENLLKAIQQFLKLCENGDRGIEDLLTIVNKRMRLRNISVKAVLDSWASQPGLPMIKVIRDYKRGNLEVSQERFFRDGGLFGRDGIRWWIPLTYTTECELAFNKTKSRKLLPPHVDSISIKGPQSAGDWVFFNIDGSGLYLVDYDEDNWNLIIDFLNNKAYFKQIPPLSRVFLINNAASLAWAGRLNYTKLLDMLKYIIHETHDHPRYAAIRRIDDLNVLLKRTPIHEKFLQYVRGILLKGHRGQSIANMLGEMRRENLEVNFDQRSGFGHIVASKFLEETILCVGDAARKHSWSEFMRWKEFPELRHENLRFLGCTRSLKVIKMYLQKSLDQRKHNVDVIDVIIAAAENERAFELVTEFVSANIKIIYERVSLNVHLLHKAIVEIARHIINEEELVWLEDFLYNNGEYFKDIPDGVEEALEIANLNVLWHNLHYETIEQYFE